MDTSGLIRETHYWKRGGWWGEAWTRRGEVRRCAHGREKERKVEELLRR